MCIRDRFYICEYFGITPQQFFDDGNAYPVQLADLVEDMKKLDAASLELSLIHI